MLPKIILIGFCLVLTACDHFPPQIFEPAPSPIIERTSEYGDLTLTATDAGCTAQLFLFKPREGEKRVLKYMGMDCGGTPVKKIKDQLLLMDLLFAQLFKKNPDVPVWSLSLYHGLESYQEMSQRWAEMAASSSEWDRKRGKARRGGENALMLKWSQGAYPELKEFFSNQGYEVRLSGVEKVLVAPAMELLGAETQLQGELPYDAQVWFELKRAALPTPVP